MSFLSVDFGFGYEVFKNTGCWPQGSAHSLSCAKHLFTGFKQCCHCFVFLCQVFACELLSDEASLRWPAFATHVTKLTDSCCAGGNLFAVCAVVTYKPG